MKIIAVNIKSGGGRELLLYLARYIKSRNLKDTFSFYVDTRFITGIDCSQNISVIQSNNLLKKKFFVLYFQVIIRFFLATCHL